MSPGHLKTLPAQVAPAQVESCSTDAFTVTRVIPTARVGLFPKRVRVHLELAAYANTLPAGIQMYALNRDQERIGCVFRGSLIDLRRRAVWTPTLPPGTQALELAVSKLCSPDTAFTVTAKQDPVWRDIYRFFRLRSYMVPWAVRKLARLVLNLFSRERQGSVHKSVEPLKTPEPSSDWGGRGGDFWSTEFCLASDGDLLPWGEPQGAMVVAWQWTNDAATVLQRLEQAQAMQAPWCLMWAPNCRPLTRSFSELCAAMHSHARAIYGDQVNGRVGQTKWSEYYAFPSFDPWAFRNNLSFPGLVALRTDDLADLLPQFCQHGEASWERALSRLLYCLPPHAVTHIAKPLANGPWEVRMEEPKVAKYQGKLPVIDVIVPTRDRADLLRQCVRSVSNTTRCELRWVILDNDSVEAETQAYFEELSAAGHRIVRAPGEFNYSALMNVGIQHCHHDFVLCLNNDIEAVNVGWLEHMLALASEPEVGCVGAKLVYPDGRIQHAGVTVGLGGIAGHLGRWRGHDDPGYMGELNRLSRKLAVTAACLLVRREVWLECGPWDEDELAVAFNDVDFCLRVNAAGYTNLYTPYARLIHHESVSRGQDASFKKSKRLALEANTIRKRWYTDAQPDPTYSVWRTTADESGQLLRQAYDQA